MEPTLSPFFMGCGPLLEEFLDKRMAEIERLVCVFAHGSHSVGRGETVCIGAMVSGIWLFLSLLGTLLPREPIDISRRSLVGLRSAFWRPVCSLSKSRVGLLSLAPSRFIVNVEDLVFSKVAKTAANEAMANVLGNRCW